MRRRCPFPQLMEPESPFVCPPHHHVHDQLELDAVHGVAFDFFDLPPCDHSILQVDGRIAAHVFVLAEEGAPLIWQPW